MRRWAAGIFQRMTRAALSTAGRVYQTSELPLSTNTMVRAICASCPRVSATAMRASRPVTWYAAA